MEIANLTPAERRVWWAFPRGETADFSQPGDEHAEHGGSWGPERTVRAEVLRTLLLSGKSADGEIAALRVTGARITGTLNLHNADVPFAIRFHECHFESELMVYGAEIRQLSLSRSYFPGLEGTALSVARIVHFSNCRVPGSLRLGGARFAGALFLNGAHIGDADSPQDQVLQLNHATIENDVVAPGLVVHGEIRLNGASIAGSLVLDEAVLQHPGATVLYAKTLSVGTDLSATRLRAVGRLNLRGLRVVGQMDFAHARLANPGDVVLRASSIVAGEFWLREAAPIEGRVTLRRSQFELLHITPDAWPDSVRLDGLTYGTLDPHLPAEERLQLLEREEDGYVPHSYEQLALSYRRIGDDDAARTVQLAKQRRRRGTLRWPLKLWGYLQDVTVGYGYRPMRAAAWLLTLMLIGSVAYGLHHPKPLKPGEAPDFNPVFYTLDLLLPIIDFGQEKAFKPHGAYQWLSYTLIITGWILATTIAAGITRALSRQ
ncbi:pentapeptide repeat-containing protein [Actinomadura sp. 6N118]|uniref:pentapeptide repeat-containing protein n=1 Tax=Actinomadura sp. 6N118 TaxID=3375151 RepID=UPI0037B1702E